MKSRLLLLTNLLTLILLGGVLFRNKLRDRPEARQVGYRTTAYAEQTEFHAHYRPAQVRAVLLGTSFTGRVQWAELLQRCDVVARGINGDVTEGMLARLDEVIRLRPTVCFLEGGLNDLEAGIPEDSIVARITRMARMLEQAGIRPVLTAVFPVGKPYPEYGKRNRSIDALNGRLQELAGKEKLAIIDINRSIAPGGVLEEDLSQPDGCHLRAEAYEWWGKAILAELGSAR